MNIPSRALAALACALLLDYSLECAREDGCAVHEDGDIASGQEAWEDFLKAASSGEAASVRLVNCYTLDDLHRYDPDYYESIKDDYPCCSSAARRTARNGHRPILI